MKCDPQQLRETSVGGAVLRGIGATMGAVLAVGVVTLFLVVIVNPWLDSVEADATEMFGPAEGWLVIFLSIILVPPFVVTMSWSGLRWAQRYWAIDHVRPKAWLFGVVAVPFAGLAFGYAGAVSMYAALAVVPLAIGAAGFLVSVSLPSPSARWPPPSPHDVQIPTR